MALYTYRRVFNFNTLPKNSSCVVFYTFGNIKMTLWLIEQPDGALTMTTKPSNSDQFFGDPQVDVLVTLSDSVTNKPICKALKKVILSKMYTIVFSDMFDCDQLRQFGRVMVELHLKPLELIKPRHTCGNLLTSSYWVTMLNEAINTDVILKVKHDSTITELKLHSALLRARLEYFEAALAPDWANSTNTLECEGFTLQAVTLLILYLYTEDSFHINRALSQVLPNSIEAIKLLAEIFRVADHFGCMGLQAVCENHLIKLASIKTFGWIIQEMYLFKNHTVELSRYLVSLCQTYTAAVTNSDQLQFITQEQLADYLIH